MMRDDAVIEMADILGYNNNTAMIPRLQRALQQAQVRLEAGPVRPWFLKEDRAYTFTNIDESRILLPPNFLEEDEDSALWYAPDDLSPDQEIKKDDLDFLIKNQKHTSGLDNNGLAVQGVPKFYAISGPYFRLFPTPDKVYKIRMIYFKKDAALDADIENNWLKYAPWLMIGEAGLSLSTAIRDQTAKAEFTRLKDAGLITLNTETEARLHANRDDYRMGDGAL